MTLLLTENPPEPETGQPGAVPPHGIRVDVDHVARVVRVRGRHTKHVLDDVAFAISPGELVAIVGPSGAGKTSLLEVIAGLVPPTQGAVYFDGADLALHRSQFRGVLGYVPQDDIIHADLPLAHTIRYAARLRLPSSTATCSCPRTSRCAWRSWRSRSR